jgi:hypothetical protein
MRGKDQQSDSLFSYIRLETRIPADHPLRPIRKLVDEALLELSPAFSKLYAREGRPSIPPERLSAHPDLAHLPAEPGVCNRHDRSWRSRSASDELLLSSADGSS